MFIEMQVSVSLVVPDLKYCQNIRDSKNSTQLN